MQTPPKIYPTNDHQALADLLGIKHKDKVLDIGAGHNPFVFADVVVDIDISSGHDRDGNSILLDWGKYVYVQADFSYLPFQDNSFDFVISLHVLEHVNDPGLACEELMRVARRGFIETPRKWTELYAGYPTHKWLIDDSQGALVFEPVEYNTAPFLNFALPSLWRSRELLDSVAKFSYVPYIQLEWDTRFDYKVRKNSVAFIADLKAPVFAKKHYAFARNLLYWAVSPNNGLYHAFRAVELAPDNRNYKKLYAFYLAYSGQWRKAFQNGLTLKHAIKAMIAVIFHKISCVALNFFKYLTKLFPGI